MAWTNHQIFLAVLLVFTGSINTLSTKWADSLKAVGSDGVERSFEHPFMQALAMFLGETMCLVTFKCFYYYYRSKGDGSENTSGLTKGTRVFNPFILLIPAMCDMISTSVMYIGLNMTYASSFQMFRGSVIIFVGLLSVAFLRRRLKAIEWSGMVLVLMGLALVGVSDFINGDDGKSQDKNGVITGDMLIIAAQVITAAQMVIEEKFVAGMDIPALQAVGWEGLFGFVVLGAMQVPLYYIHAPAPFSNNPRGVLEDVVEGFVQMGANPLIVVSLLGTVVSIAFFNYAGVSVTKEMSATTRMVLDSVRTVFIWLVSLGAFGQKFEWLQLIGFTVLIYGMFLYNGITIVGPLVARLRGKVRPARDYDTMQEAGGVENHAAEKAGMHDAAAAP